VVHRGVVHWGVVHRGAVAEPMATESSGAELGCGEGHGGQAEGEEGGDLQEAGQATRAWAMWKGWYLAAGRPSPRERAAGLSTLPAAPPHFRAANVGTAGKPAGGPPLMAGSHYWA
jgi:hypothetical protein